MSCFSAASGWCRASARPTSSTAREWISSDFSPAPLPRKTAFLMIARLLKDKGIREFGEAAKRVKAALRCRDHPCGRPRSSPDSLTPSELDELIRVRDRLSRLCPRRAAGDRGMYGFTCFRPTARERRTRCSRPWRWAGAIITTDAPGCRETVKDGENGFLVKPRDSARDCRAMMRFVKNPDWRVRWARLPAGLPRRSTMSAK